MCDQQNKENLIKSRKNKPILLHEEYKYRYFKTDGPKSKLRCTKKSCKAYAKTEESNVELLTLHNHEILTETEQKALKVNKEINTKSEFEGLTNKHIISMATKALTDEEMAKIPNVET
jgi:hypothetical protein